MKAHIPNEEDAKSYALRLLIHYIGDIHQPLHASARVDKKYPKGDAGGNFFTVPAKENTKNLHAVWDSAVYAYTDTPKLVSYLSNPLYFGFRFLANLITLLYSLSKPPPGNQSQ